MASVALARAYQHSFDTHPYATLAFTNGALTAVGDGVAQTAQLFLGNRTRHEHDPPFRYDTARTLRFFTFGFALGPVIGRWNQVLEKYFPLRIGQAARQPGAGDKVSARALAKRVAVDQLFMAPIGIALFIGSMSYMEGRDSEHIKDKYKSMYFPALQANWQVWPLVQLVNFRYMPLPYRVPFQSTCGVFWTLYLSILNSRQDQKQDTRDHLRGTADLRPVNPAHLVQERHVDHAAVHREQQGHIERISSQ